MVDLGEGGSVKTDAELAQLTGLAVALHELVIRLNGAIEQARATGTRVNLEAVAKGFRVEINRMEGLNRQAPASLQAVTVSWQILDNRSPDQ